MSIPDPAVTDWVPLAYGPAPSGVDYEGDWSAGVSYQAGNVVRHNGVDYIAVNPSTGQTPPGAGSPTIGTVMPSSPVDGQEFTLVDSLTAPTYAWRFRYIASITDSYKWVFVGGASLHAIADGPHLTPTNQGSYIALTGGPDVTLPRAGIYNVEQGFQINSYNDAGGGAGGKCYMSYTIGATAAVDADAVNSQPYIGALAFAVSGNRMKTFPAAGTILSARYRHDNYGSNVYWAKRWLRVTPVRVS
jgi:hypothetical protein